MFVQYGIMHLCILVAMYYYLGLLWTVISLIAFFQIIDLVIDYFGFQFAVGQDIIHFFDSEKVIPNCVGYMEMKKLDFDTLKNENLYKKGIMNVRKLRQIPRNILGFFLWQDVSSAKAIQQVSALNDTFANENDVIKF